MVECELCGSKYARRKIKYEGTVITVCDNCIKYGEELPQVEFLKVEKRPIKMPEELEQIINPNFPKIIKKEREKRNLTQEQLAKKLNEKFSVIKRIEDGWEPSLVLTKKLEKFFSIKLIEIPSKNKLESKVEKKKLTIGDVVEVK